VVQKLTGASPVSRERASPRRRAWLWGLAFFLLLCAAGMAVDAVWVEPNWIEVTYHEIHGAVASPLKIAHLTDLHTWGLGRRERNLLVLLEREQPDIIVITGDSLATSGGTYPMVRQVLEKLHAPLGVWLVRGNWENWSPVKHEKAFYESAGVHLLVNSGEAVRPDVWIAGLDDPYSGAANLSAAIKGIPANMFLVTLFHSPAFFNRIAGRVDLCLVGHTHGGQVHIPWVRPWWLPGGCGRFVAGWYEQRGSRMYVSRGLGMSILPIRFLCRPELAIITVEP
jgi:uncharacterized protein